MRSNIHVVYYFRIATLRVHEFLPPMRFTLPLYCPNQRVRYCTAIFQHFHTSSRPQLATKTHPNCVASDALHWRIHFSNQIKRLSQRAPDDQHGSRSLGARRKCMRAGRAHMDNAETRGRIKHRKLNSWLAAIVCAYSRAYSRAHE